MRERSWTKEQLEVATLKSRSLRQILSCLGLREAGGNYVQLKKYIKEYSIDTSHLKGRAWNKGLKVLFKPKVSLKNILTQGSNFQSYKLKNRLLREGLKPYHCESCGWAQKTENGRLPLELHHVNGDGYDNRLENLIILCPNCHSLRPNYRGLNIKNARVSKRYTNST